MSLEKERAKGDIMNWYLVILATLVAWALSSSAAGENTPGPDIAGPWKMSISGKRSECKDPRLNGPYQFEHDVILVQTGAHFTLKLRQDLGPDRRLVTRESGSRTREGQINSKYVQELTASGKTERRNEGTFSGKVQGDRIDGTFEGRFVFGEACSFSGTRSLKRLPSEAATRLLRVEAFKEKARVDTWLEEGVIGQLMANPFAWKGKLVGFAAKFQFMKSESVAVFSVGGANFVVISNVPIARFTAAGQEALVAGRVGGMSQTSVPLLGAVPTPEMVLVALE